MLVLVIRLATPNLVLNFRCALSSLASTRFVHNLQQMGLRPCADFASVHENKAALVCR